MSNMAKSSKWTQQQIQNNEIWVNEEKSLTL